jgi:peptidoglycan/LPS O-acetylase OafA/YrhL
VRAFLTHPNVEHQAAPLGFRHDINGLRAWAVIFVVLYHFGVPGVTGGFAGVDVFFVISGFLMTAVVVKGLRTGRFNLWQFYLARARRIWPALIVLCAVLLAFGWFMLIPEEYRALGKHARDSLLFSSNLRYLKEAGYFAMASEQKWLLHTWSLSVEWQFYLIFPLVVAVLWRLFPKEKGLYLALFGLLCGSLGWSIWSSLFEAERAFFVLSSRGWELLCGGLVFGLSERLVLSAVQRRAMLFIGMLLMFAATFLLDSSMVWPGGWALLPVLSAALLILANAEQTPLLHAPVLQWFGSRSYSLYLWHWPVVVGLKLLGGWQMYWVMAAGMLMALGLAHVSYQYVEEPTRRLMARHRGWPLVCVLIASLALVASVAQWVRKSEFSNRLPMAVQQMAAQAQNHSSRLQECTHKYPECFFGGDSIRVIVIGDSHAGAVVEAVNDSLMNASQGVYMRASAGCLLVFGARKDSSSSQKCTQLQAWAQQELPGLYPGVPVLLAMRTTAYVKGGMPGEPGQLDNQPEYHFSKPYSSPQPAFLAEFRANYVASVCALTAHHPVYLLRPTPEMPVSVPDSMARDMLWGRERQYQLSLMEYQQRHAFTWSVQDQARDQCGAQILDPLPFLCSDTVCPAAADGAALYFDDDHLSRAGYTRLIPLFRKAFSSP